MPAVAAVVCTQTAVAARASKREQVCAASDESLSSEYTQAVSRACNSFLSTMYTYNSITSLYPPLLFANVDSTE
jgi:hypothetical protein